MRVRTESKPFFFLLGLTLLLVIFGLVMVTSASSVDSLRQTNSAYNVFGRQAIYAGLGLVLMFIISRVPVSWMRNLAPVALFSTLALQLLTVIFGEDINGNRNWLAIGPITLQPSEFLKLGLILATAAIIASNYQNRDNFKTWIAPILFLGISLGLVAGFGRDVGTGIVIAVLGVGMFALGGMRWGQLLSMIALGSLLGILAIMSSASRSARFQAWLFPDSADPMGVRWQYEHGTWALAAGGLFGTGLGKSKLKWSWIPEVENDFIFAIIGEELGLIGAFGVVGLFIALAVTFMVMIHKNNDPFQMLVIGGVMTWIIMQALINISVVLGALPVLGVPLPLISAGGSSLIATLGAIGVVLAIERSRHAQEQKSKKLVKA
ncbi:MAG TPA: putative peptidoglycan glycosyltransferase FtsW [Microbacteriaceae bacterium]